MRRLLPWEPDGLLLLLLLAKREAIHRLLLLLRASKLIPKESEGRLLIAYTAPWLLLLLLRLLGLEGVEEGALKVRRWKRIPRRRRRCWCRCCRRSLKLPRCCGCDSESGARARLSRRGRCWSWHRILILKHILTDGDQFFVLKVQRR